MNVEELLRTSLHDEAQRVDPITDLLSSSVALGRRKQRVRRASLVSGSAVALAAVVGGGIAVANLSPDDRASVTPGTTGGSPSGSDATPWWDTWPGTRHYGPIDKPFVASARPQYDGEQQPEQIDVWATGTMPDGTDWVMFTSPTTGHALQRVQGWNGEKDYADGQDVATPDMTWTSWTSPTLAAHNDYRTEQEWLIVVGRPGTTAISYAADGTTFTAMDVRDGIGVMKIDGYIPQTAKVQLADASGVYATGTPYGAGPDPLASPSPTEGTEGGTPTPTPPNATARAQRVTSKTG
jgi:hypothetical protein